ncbi:30S ribosomal protein S13 [uncultured archaeon]|nr:30S ribosomal protein S13 [uncultured archaeon]
MAEKPTEKTEKAPQQEKKQHPRGRPQQAAPKAIVSASGKEVRGIVRLAGRDLNGTLPIKRAITSVKGVGVNLGEVISGIAYQQLGLSDKTLVGELSEEEIEKLEHILHNLPSYGVPIRMLNRRKDMFTGNDVHLIGSDLSYMVKQDIDHERDSYTWKGYRFTYGQKVRGQRTRSTGRTGMTVGVLRKAVLAKAGGAAAVTGAVAQAAGAAAAAPAAGGKAPAAPKAAAPAAKAAAPAKEAKK